MAKKTETTIAKKTIAIIIKMIAILPILAVLAAPVMLFSSCGAGSEDSGYGAGTAEQSSVTGTQSSQTSRPSETSQTTPGGPANSQSNTSPDKPSDGATDAETADPKESPIQTDDGKDGVSNLISEMSLDEKIGQLFIVGFQGIAPDNALMELIRQKHIGGVILFKRNIKDPEKLYSLNNLIKKINSNNNKVPLFISVDEEGGRISRMPGQVKKLPSAKSIGEINSINLSNDLGSLLALQTKAFGFNMDFAPVLDIWSNPQNTVIGDRAFGTTPETVVKNGIQVMQGIRDGGVIPVVKHFPGHGDTIVDSHVGLPAVDYDMGRLKSFEWVPFQSAIEKQADAVMISHILMTKIDPENPATLSKTIITDILRKQMGFDGVVITDDMTMGAIENNYNIGDAAVKSLIAGSDIVLVCHGYEKQLEAISAVKAAVNDGLISEERIIESVYRILMLKEKYHLSDQPTAAADLEDINKKIEALSVK